ncbi:hypothetical protein GUJ93_ZPchr0001g29618 [Zizania palustris]|uniref:Uncharacterized protein n=1 Tax=Zizania palustris TaxID=103762 RepID=A0A8J5RQE0_ZIZPA|nr:hypothetical protein GUJ93_ZPchr0001g29618 [Zizania palustris]
MWSSEPLTLTKSCRLRSIANNNARLLFFLLPLPLSHLSLDFDTITFVAPVGGSPACRGDLGKVLGACYTRDDIIDLCTREVQAMSRRHDLPWDSLDNNGVRCV